MSLAKANRGSTQQNYHVGSLVWVPEQAAQVSLRMAGALQYRLVIATLCCKVVTPGARVLWTQLSVAKPPTSSSSEGGVQQHTFC